MKRGRRRSAKRIRRANRAGAGAATRSFLGLEGGASRTVAVLVDGRGRIRHRSEGGPCHLRLTGDREMLALWRQFRRDLIPVLDGTRPTAVGAFLAGCRTAYDKAALRRLLKSVWPHSIPLAGNDMESAFASAFGSGDGILVICGTGSVVCARKRGAMIRVGGWGHVGGDRGSGYWMGRELLRSIFRARDELDATDALARSALTFLGLNKLEELVRWSLEATKPELASLTRVLFRHARHPACQRIVQEAVDILASDAALAGWKAGLLSSRAPVPVAVSPGLAKYQPLFRRRLAEAIREKIQGARVFLSATEGAIGGAWLAARAFREQQGDQQRRAAFPVIPSAPPPAQDDRRQPTTSSRSLAASPTEQRNPRTMNLDRLSIRQLIGTMLDEESRTLPAVARQTRSIERVIEWIVVALRRRGRLFYVGAGTSGRLGVLDAAECPPTFGCGPEMVQGIIAGGNRALVQAVEAAEDNANYGRQAIRNRGVRRGDVVVGISASGSTPFVLGALEEALGRGARTALLTFNPYSEPGVQNSEFRKIVIPTGPEVIAGSTRLKAGTATKIVLNLFSTIAMIRLGKVRSNLMVDLEPVSRKLHDRAARIYALVKHVTYEEAWGRLEQRGWNLKGLLKRSA